MQSSEADRQPTDASGWPARLEQIIRQDLHREQRQRSRARYCPELTYGRHFAPPGPTARPAAVMILLEQPAPGAHWSQCCIPLTVRPQHLIDHPGQISLPGGRLEASENFEQAAMREFCEELGVDRFPGRLIGPLLPLWVFNSDYRLQPFLAIHTGRLDYRPCPREVARVIRLPIAALCGEMPPTGDTAVQQSRFSRGGVSWRAGIFEYQQDQIWGATAIVLAELAALLSALDRA